MIHQYNLSSAGIHCLFLARRLTWKHQGFITAILVISNSV